MPVNLVHSAPLFHGISPHDRTRISALARVKEFARSEPLYIQGDPVREITLLASGIVKISQVGPSGAEVILSIEGPGDVLGVRGAFFGGRHFTGAQALRPCLALAWEARAFESLAQGFPVLRQNLIRILEDELRELEQRFGEAVTENVGQRVARQLARLTQKIGRPVNGAFEINLSREELAQMTGTTLFTVSRLLSAWAGRGILRPGRRSVAVFDIESLLTDSDAI